jgi:hypothetical protein
MRTKTCLLALVLFVITLCTIKALAVPEKVEVGSQKSEVSPSHRRTVAPVLAQATPEATAAAITTRVKNAVWPYMVKLALIVGTARLLLKPIVEYFRGGSPITGKSILNWLLSINTHPIKCLTFCLLSSVLFLGSGCVGYTPGAITKQLKDDHATVSMTLVTPWGTQRVIRTNPGSNQTSTINVDGSVTVTSK